MIQSRIKAQLERKIVHVKITTSEAGMVPKTIQQVKQPGSQPDTPNQTPSPANPPLKPIKRLNSTKQLVEQSSE